MATTQAGGLTFEIVADPRQFRSAVADARDGWRSATADMRETASGLGTSLQGVAGEFGRTVGRIAEAQRQGIVPLAKELVGVAQQAAEGVQKAFGSAGGGLEAGMLAAFDNVNTRALGVFDKVTDKVAGLVGGVVGKYLGKTGDELAQFGVKALADYAKPAVTEGLRRGVGLISDGFDKLVGVALPAANKIGAAFDDRFAAVGTSAEETVKRVQTAFDGITGRKRNAAGEAEDTAAEPPKPEIEADAFEAITRAIEKQIAAQSRSVELIGRSAGEVARLRNEWAAIDAGATLDKMSEAQSARIETLRAGLAAAADDAALAKKIDTQRSVLVGLEAEARQKEQVAALEASGVARTAEERARLQAMLQISKQLGKELVDLSDDERERVERIADARADDVRRRETARADETRRREAERADEVRRRAETRAGNTTRDTVDEMARRSQQLRLEAETLGMSTAAAAAYKAEQTALLKLRQDGIPTIGATADAVRREAGAIGDATAALERDKAVRSQRQDFARAVESIELEAAAMRMGTAEAAGYRHEMESLARFKQSNIVVSRELQQEIKREAETIQQATASAQRQREMLRAVSEVGQVATRSLTSAFDDFMEGREIRWKGMVDSMLKDLARLSFQRGIEGLLFGGGGSGQSGGGILGAILGAVSGTSGTIAGAEGWQTTYQSAGGLPGFAAGGPVTAGAPIIVGEQGPEVFRPSAPGWIEPNRRMAQEASGAPQFVYNIDARGAEIGVEQRIASALAAARPGIIAESVRTVRDQSIRQPGFIR